MPTLRTLASGSHIFTLFIIILAFFVSSSNCNICQNCVLTLKYACTLCSQYCPSQQVQLYSQCSFQNCSNTDQNDCMVYLSAINNGSAHVTENSCKDNCCRGTGNDLWVDIRDTCVNQGNSSFPIYISYPIAFGCIAILAAAIIIYRKCCSRASSPDSQRTGRRRRGIFSIFRRESEQKMASDIPSQAAMSEMKSAQFTVPPQQTQCPICLDPRTNALTKCKHSFHFNCLYEWSKRNYQCPLCKSDGISEVYILCPKCQAYYVLISLRKIQRDREMMGDGVIVNAFCQNCLE